MTATNRQQTSARTALVFGLALLAYLTSSGLGHTAYDNYVRLAQAFLHGSVSIPDPGPGIDALHYGSRFYIIEGPLPALFVLPAVMVFGVNANQSFVCVVCGAVAVTATDIVLGRMEVSQYARNATLAFVAVGTVLWWCTAFGAVWMYAHVAAVMLAMLVLAEMYGKRRAWLIGFLLVAAALSRFPLVLSAPPLIWWVLSESVPSERARRFASLCAGVAPLLLLYVAYNVARWGVPSDIGYTVWYHQDQVGQPTGSPFRLEYLPFNLYSLVMLAPEFSRAFPWFRPTSFGVSLTLTSPALAIALAGLRRNRESVALGTAAVLVALPSLFYYVNGFEQFGMRHSLDFLPFLIPLVGRGLERVPRIFAASSIGYSVAANAYGMWYSWAYHAYTVVPRF
ncbi:MAG: hypothetical protein GIW99_04275 [Candidatus Eremiobacteraeota bacterium]|nr:hypothetical protein [Candidatus Eremiobacteraeota bacterium]MBC5826889.1 hypothetical protein [Candidatus Eremiobacteraeota bacterium]